MEKKNKKKEVYRLLNAKLKELNCGPEDLQLIIKLVESYFRKRSYISNSKTEITAAGIIWVYSKINFLWEGNKKWGLENIAKLFDVRPKTAGNKASEIMKALKIDYWDDRFARAEVAKNNPYKKFVVAPNGMIIPREMLTESVFSNSFKSEKEDYFYDGLELLDEDEYDKAIECFKKALEIDENYVDAYNGFGNTYLLLEDYDKAKEYYKKAYELTKKHFKEVWPKRLEWGILENRQYLRAICGFAICLWRDKNFQEAERFIRLLLELNPRDNQEARYILASILKGLSFEEFDKIEDKATESGNYGEIDKLFEEQNKIHNFYTYEEE